MHINLNFGSWNKKKSFQCELLQNISVSFDILFRLYAGQKKWKILLFKEKITIQTFFLCTFILLIK